MIKIKILLSLSHFAQKYRYPDFLMYSSQYVQIHFAIYHSCPDQRTKHGECKIDILVSKSLEFQRPGSDSVAPVEKRVNLLHLILLCLCY